MDNSDKFLFLMSTALNRIKYHSIKRFSEAGVSATPAQMGILFLLKPGKPLSMSDISSALSIDNSTLTRNADRLVKEGYAERIPDENDRRILKLAITPKGSIERKKAAVISNRINSEIISGLTEEESRMFSGILEGIIKKFDQNYGGNNE